MSARLVVVTTGGIKREQDYPTVERAMTVAFSIMKRSTRGVREIRITGKGGHTVCRWRSYTTWSGGKL